MATKNAAGNAVAKLVLLLLSFLFIIGVGMAARISEPVKVQCNTVYGVESGDICVTIQQRFSLITSEFRVLNPNLNCRSLFVGQWICVNGRVTN
ncbi:hypothetical protein LINPERPRIM_LOCUS13918 [Linum perenne]